MSEQSATRLAGLVSRECQNLLDQSMVKIRNCLDQLSDEQVWWRPGEALNSIGNLLLHIEGNLRQWAIAGVGGQADQRDRQSEFDRRKMIPQDELWGRLSAAVADSIRVLDGLQPDDWLSDRRIQEFQVSVLGAVWHTTTHFVGHTHQIILLTRLQLGDDYRFAWSPENDRGSVPI